MVFTLFPSSLEGWKLEKNRFRKTDRWAIVSPPRFLARGEILFFRPKKVGNFSDQQWFPPLHANAGPVDRHGACALQGLRADPLLFLHDASTICENKVSLNTKRIVIYFTTHWSLLVNIFWVALLTLPLLNVRTNVFFPKNCEIKSCFSFLPFLLSKKWRR